MRYKFFFSIRSNFNKTPVSTPYLHQQRGHSVQTDDIIMRSVDHTACSTIGKENGVYIKILINKQKFAHHLPFYMHLLAYLFLRQLVKFVNKENGVERRVRV